MHISKKLGIALAAVGVLALSACGGSSSSSSGNRTKNAALTQPEKMIGEGEVVVNITGIDGNVRGIATDGAKLYVRTSANPNGAIYETGFDGQNTVKHEITNPPGDVHYEQTNLAMSHGCIWTSSHGGNLYCIATSNWTAAQIAVPEDKPLPYGQYWIQSNLLDFPDGRIARISYPSIEDGVAQSTLRVYNVKGTGTSATISWDRDYTLTDTEKWPSDDHGIATDGKYLYRIRYAMGYKVWDLSAGNSVPVLFNGDGSGTCGASGTRCSINPAGIGNATFITHDHINGRYLVGDYEGQRYYYTSATNAQPVATPTSAPVVETSAPTTMPPPSSSSTEPVKVESFMVDQSDTMLVESDETYNVANNKTFRAPAGKKFGTVLWASYGTPSVNNKVLTLSGCHSTKSAAVVQAASENKTSFVLPAGNGNYGDPCYGTYKRVKALITLVNDESYVADPMLTGVQTDAPDTAFFETPEHYAKPVTAPEGKLFGKVLFASYGIQNLKGNMVSIGWCHSTRSVGNLQTILTNKKSGTIPAQNSDYGDPCYGTYKYVKVVMQLIDDPSYVKPVVTTTSTIPPSIAAPTNVAVTAGTGSATINWDASAKGNTEVLNYLVQYSTDNFVNATTLNVTSLEALAVGLANGQEHSFRVAGVNKTAGVISDWSTVVKATPVAPAETTTTTIAPDAVVTVLKVETDKKSVITTDTATIDCDQACYDSIASQLGVIDGPVWVSVDGGERIKIDGKQYTKINVGTSGKKLTFMTMKDDVVQQTSINLDRSGKSAPAVTGGSSESGSGSDSSSNMLWLLLAILIVLLLGGGGYAYSRKGSKE